MIGASPSSAPIRFIHPVLWIVACVLLPSCGRSDPEPPPDILKAQREALDKAKATEQVLQDAAQRRDAQIESQQK